MKTRYLLIGLLFCLFLSCDNGSGLGIDKKRIGNADKLNSPYSSFTLYRYHVESSMAFGSGVTAIQILPAQEKCDFTEGDFLTFGNHYPLSIKWKSKDTLHVKCLGQGGLAARQPVSTEIKKWKDWTFEVEYYTIYSTGTNGSHLITDHHINQSNTVFNSDEQKLIFNNSEVVMQLDSSLIKIRQYKVDTFKLKTGLALSEYELNMNGSYRMSDFYKLQPFISIKP